MIHPPPLPPVRPEDRPAAIAAGPVRAPIASEVLFAGAREVQILHGGSVYRLKLTALGKLILTK